MVTIRKPKYSRNRAVVSNYLRQQRLGRQEGSTPWTPADIVTSAWFDASDASTITESGGSVSTWGDKSGNEYHVTQGTVANQPTTGTRTIGGLNTLDFDGNDFLRANSRLGFSANPNIMIISVHSPDQAGMQLRLCTIGNGDGVLSPATDNSWRFNNGNEVYNSSLASSTIGVWERASGSTYADSKFYENGVEQTSTDVTNGTPNNTVERFVIGAKGDGTIQFNGRIGELVIIESTDIDIRQKMEGYLAWKWGLEATLPLGHPYKNGAPTL